LILAYPLYEKLIIKDTYRSKVLYYVYAPLSVICVLLLLWITISINIESSKLNQRLSKQEDSTKSLFGDNLKISSIEIRARYIFEYKSELKAKFRMYKANPLKLYFVNTDIKKDSLSFECDNPKVYYPKNNTVEFKFDFSPENMADLSGNSLDYLEKYDKIYFPWKSFTHYLALLKVGGPVEQSTDPMLIFQIIINGKVLIDHEGSINNLDPGSVIVIFNTEPEIFADIINRFLEL
jgi:hypothetical protein